MLSQPNKPTPEIEADVRARLGRVCERYSPDEFDALVRQIVSIRVKYEARHADAFLSAARELAAERIGGARGQ
jgi:hypothetical protein